MKRFSAICLLAVLCSCALFKPERILVHTPAQTVIKYLPAETIVSRDSTATEIVHDTVTNRDTVRVTKWRETVREKRVIDTVPQWIVRNDTISVEHNVGMKNWQAYTLIVVFFLLGGGIVYVVTRVFR